MLEWIKIVDIPANYYGYQNRYELKISNTFSIKIFEVCTQTEHYFQVQYKSGHFYECSQTLEEAKEIAIKVLTDKYNELLKEITKFNEFLQDPTKQFACAVLSGDPVSIDAVKDILKC